MTFEMIFAVVFAVLISQSNAYRHYYMDQMCDTILELTKGKSSGILTLTRKWLYDHNMDCTLTIRAPPNQMMLFRIIKMEVDTDKYRCNDWVQIYDGNKLKSSPAALTSKICGHTEPSQVFTSSGRDISVKFVSNYYDNDIGFDMVFNIFNKEPCNTEEFTCNNGRCIPYQLKCARYDNCGDGSNICRSHTWIIFGAVIGCFSLVAVIVLGVYLIQHSGYKTRQEVLPITKETPNQSDTSTQPMLPQN